MFWFSANIAMFHSVEYVTPSYQASAIKTGRISFQNFSKDGLFFLKQRVFHGIFVSKATTKGDSTIFLSKAIQPCLFQRQHDDSMRFFWWNTGRGAQNALKLDRMHEIECKGRVDDKSRLHLLQRQRLLRLQRQRLLRLQRQRLLQRPCASITVGVFVSNMTCNDKIMYGSVNLQ